jgi:hypothetical protein
VLKWAARLQACWNNSIIVEKRSREKKRGAWIGIAAAILIVLLVLLVPMFLY